MSNGSFRRALLDVDRELASVPFAGERNVRSIVSARRRSPWRLPALALAVAIMLLLVVRSRDREPAVVAGFTTDAPASSWQTRGNELEVLAPTLDLDIAGFGHIVAERGARVARIDGGIHVLGGNVDVAIIHRPAGVAPAVVRVSHGTIAVLGTRFTIEQREQGGAVVLHEGRIRFDAGDRSVVLVPGSSLTWPLEQVASADAVVPQREATSPATAPQGVAPHSDVPTSDVAPRRPARVEVEAPHVDDASAQARAESGSEPLDVDHVITQVKNLRSRRRFADAAALLERTLTAELPTATLERLSYELGEIQTYQLASSDRACRHWSAHRERFPQGRYTVEVDAAVRRLGCKETTP
jgi:transmembrane sensor